MEEISLSIMAIFSSDVGCRCPRPKNDILFGGGFWIRFWWERRFLRADILKVVWMD